MELGKYDLKTENDDLHKHYRKFWWSSDPGVLLSSDGLKVIPSFILDTEEIKDIDTHNATIRRTFKVNPEWPLNLKLQWKNTPEDFKEWLGTLETLLHEVANDIWIKH